MDSTYGYRCYDNTIVASLVHTAQFPDKHSGRGVYEFTLRVGIGENTPKLMGDEVERFINPLRYVPTNVHKGDLKADGVLAQFSAQTSTITSIARTKDSGILVRINELEGERDDVILKFGVPITKARVVDLLENEKNSLRIENDTIYLTVNPYRICGLEIEILENELLEKRICFIN